MSFHSYLSLSFLFCIYYFFLFVCLYLSLEYNNDVQWTFHDKRALKSNNVVSFAPAHAYSYRTDSLTNRQYSQWLCHMRTHTHTHHISIKYMNKNFIYLICTSFIIPLIIWVYVCVQSTLFLSYIKSVWEHYYTEEKNRCFMITRGVLCENPCVAKRQYECFPLLGNNKIWQTI